MAITRSQQARQMLKKAGFVVQDGFKNYIKDSESVTVPKEFKSREDATPTKLAYITKDEAKMLKKMKKGTPHKGPKGIPSYDDFDADTGTFRSGAAMSAAETGGKTDRDRADLRQAGVSPEEARDIRLAAIASGAGQRVNPGFFDSRNVIPRADVLAAKKAFPKAFARTRGGGILGFLTSGGILGNLIRGLGQRFGLGKKFDQPTYDMRKFSDLGLLTSRVNPNNLDIYNEFVDDEDDTNTITPKISSSPLSLSDTELQNRINIANQFQLPLDYSANDLQAAAKRAMTQPGLSIQLKNDPNIPDEIEFLGGQKFTATPYDPYKDRFTPFQKDVIEGPQQQADDDMFKGAMTKLNKPGLIQLRNYQKKKGLAPLDPNINFTDEDQKVLDELLRREADPDTTYGPVLRVADGGMIGGGIMDAAGRQQYFLGKLVKKATRAVKKIVKSPIGRLGLFAAASAIPFGASKASLFQRFMDLEKGQRMLAGAGLLSAAPLLLQQEEEEPGFTRSPGGEIDPRAYTDPYGVLYQSFKAEGGSMKDEPVAKRTMPLLDMGGQEMDLRAEGGFVPIGRMEKADDVPARLSKNEFVFTADAVRNAGDGDVDKGAEVMYNMMKNLEAGGDVSKESQGLEGARNMFQTSKRLEEIL